MDSQPHEDPCLTASVAQLPVDAERPLVARLPGAQVLLEKDRRAALDRQQSCAKRFRDGIAEPQELLRPPFSLCERLRRPEDRENRYELGGERGLRLARPLDRRAHVVDLRMEEVRALHHGLEGCTEVRGAGDGEHTGCMAGPQLLEPALVPLLEPCPRELADRLEHPVAVGAPGVGAPTDEALVDEGGERVEIGVADLLGSLERAAAAKDGEVCEELLLAGGQQVVRPFDRRPQRGVPGIGVTRAREIEARRKPLEQRLGCEKACARGGQLEGEREAVEALAERRDDPAGLELRVDGAGARDEEGDGVVRGEGRKVEPSLGCDLDRLAARHQQAERGRGVDES